MLGEVEYRDWASKLCEISDSQMVDLYARLELFKKNGRRSVVPSKSSVQLDENDWLFDGVFHTLCNKGLASKAARQILLKRSRGYQRSIADVIEELDPLIPKRNKRISRLRLGIIIGRCLIRWVEKRNPHLPVTAVTILNMISHSREALELGFPGYIASGCFKLVLEGMSEESECLTS